MKQLDLPMDELKKVHRQIYVHPSAELMTGHGIALGLSDEAISMLSHFNEVELDIEIEVQTGMVLKCEVTK